jgi:hypothetical protein
MAREGKGLALPPVTLMSKVQHGGKVGASSTHEKLEGFSPARNHRGGLKTTTREKLIGFSRVALGVVARGMPRAEPQGAGVGAGAGLGAGAGAGLAGGAAVPWLGAWGAASAGGTTGAPGTTRGDSLTPASGTPGWLDRK